MVWLHVFRFELHISPLVCWPWNPRFQKKITATVLPFFHNITWIPNAKKYNLLKTGVRCICFSESLCMIIVFPHHGPMSIHQTFLIPEHVVFLYRLYTTSMDRMWIPYGWRWFERNRTCERLKLCPSAACKSVVGDGQFAHLCTTWIHSFWPCGMANPW